MHKLFPKPWRFAFAFALGLGIGFAGGTGFFSKYLDKPEIVNQNNIKQKVKGKDNTAGQAFEYETPIAPPETENSEPKKKPKKRR